YRSRWSLWPTASSGRRRRPSPPACCSPRSAAVDPPPDRGRADALGDLALQPSTGGGGTRPRHDRGPRCNAGETSPSYDPTQVVPADVGSVAWERRMIMVEAEGTA